MNASGLFLAICCVALSVCRAGHAGQAHDPHTGHPSETADLSHGAGAATVSFTELQATVDALRRARAATEKYQDVRAAEADGYRSFGPYVRGQGLHYVNPRLAAASRGIDIERPPILLYANDESVRGGLKLVGVSYLLAAPTGTDGQPVDAPFPRALAAWHRHNDICLFPNRSVLIGASEADCQQRGGRFIAETDWMVHAWIWKDSPAGVFSPTNPDVE
jgi:hypothetical protein